VAVVYKIYNFPIAIDDFGGRSVGIVRLRTKGHGVFFCFVCL
jgi:hypothetical protein